MQDNAQVREYTVLATNATYDIAAIGQLYRDRCDCENGFDESGRGPLSGMFSGRLLGVSGPTRSHGGMKKPLSC